MILALLKNREYVQVSLDDISLVKSVISDHFKDMTPNPASVSIYSNLPTDKVHAIFGILGISNSSTQQKEISRPEPGTSRIVRIQ